MTAKLFATGYFLLCDCHLLRTKSYFFSTLIFLRNQFHTIFKLLVVRLLVFCQKQFCFFVFFNPDVYMFSVPPSGGRSGRHPTPFSVWRSWSLAVASAAPSSAPSTRARSSGSSASPATSPCAWSVPPRCTGTTAAAPRGTSSITTETASESWSRCTWGPVWSVSRSRWRRCNSWKTDRHLANLTLFQIAHLYLPAFFPGRGIPGGFAGTG